MRAGPMRHRGSLQQATGTLDDYGDPMSANTWTTQAVQWMHIAPMSATERERYAQQDPSITHSIRMRYNPDVDTSTSWRILWDKRFFNIKTVMDVGERRKEMIVAAEEDLTRGDA
ncbi:MAG: phage head closure protein [Chloroflexi bacterium]|nr:phage head closure protein [Chloroflexota bacterium]